MARRFEHLLILLPWLHRNNGVSFEQTMKEFGRSAKELTEDLTLLTLVGTGPYAMQQFELSWHDGNIYVRDNLGIDRAFRFDGMETACLLIGLELLEQLADTRHDFSAADIESLRQKLQSTLPVTSTIQVVEDDALDPGLDLIGSAIEANRQLSFEYDNVSRDDRTLRTVSPLRVISAAAAPILQAWDHASGGWRSFRVERMNEVRLADTESQLPVAPFAEMSTVEVQILVSQDRLELLERFAGATIAEITDQGAHAYIRVAEPQWLARVCQAAGGAIKVLAPASMVQAVQAQLEQALAAYK